MLYEYISTTIMLVLAIGAGYIVVLEMHEMFKEGWL